MKVIIGAQIEEIQSIKDLLTDVVEEKHYKYFFQRVDGRD